MSVALGGLLGCDDSPEPGPPAPPVVTVEPASQRDVTTTAEYVGRIEGMVDAEIRARVPGFLLRQDYEEGRPVRAGQKLFTIDPAETTTRFDSAASARSRAEAVLANRRVAVERLRPLAEQRAVSQQDLDDALAAESAAAAQLEGARADVEAARLQRSYTEVRSPIAGIAGTALVRLGNLVGQGEPTLLTTVSQVDRVRVTFSITEREYLELARAGIGQTGEADRVRLQLADGSTYEHPGTIAFAERGIDRATNTLEVQAIFPNPEGLLRSGQSARVIVRAAALPQAVLVPQRAVSELLSEQRIGVVDDGGAVHVRRVSLGPAIGNEYVVTEGVRAGERVIVAGLGNVTEGQQVEARAPEAASTPSAPSAPPEVVPEPAGNDAGD